MSADVTTLGLAVDSSQVVRAKKDLDGMTVGMDKAAGSASKMEGGMSRLKGVLAGLALGATAIQLVKMADAVSLMDARLRLATGSGADFAKAQGDIYRIAQLSNVGLAETTALYTKLHEPVKRLGGGVNETSKIVEAFSAALRLGGASAQEASSATLQFGQAMGSGTLAGDEFRAMAEASPRFLKALADGMGVPIGQLKKMGSEGKLTADVVGNALVKSLGAMRQEMKSLPDTVGGAMTRLTNDFQLAVGTINKASGTTLGIASGIDAARALIPTLRDEMVGAFAQVGDWIEDNKKGLGDIWTAVKGVVTDVWELVKAGASVVGWFAQIATQAGFIKITIESIRLLWAGFQDGVTLIGGALATVGSLIMKAVVYPISYAVDIAAKLVGILDKDAADNLRDAAAQARELAGAGAKYGDDIVARFQAGDSAVMRLSAELEKAAGATTKATGATTALGLAFKPLKSNISEVSKEMEAAQKAYDRLTQSISGKVAELKQEAETGFELNEAEKQAIAFKIELTDKYKLLSAEQKKNIESLLAEWSTLLKAADATKELAKFEAELHKARMDAWQDAERAADQLNGLVARQEAENEALRFTAKELEQVRRARLDDEIAIARLKVIKDEYLLVCNAETMANRDTYEALLKLKDAYADNVHLKAAADARDAYIQLGETIYSSISDALFRAFDEGGDAFDNFMKNMERSLKKLAFQLIAESAAGTLVAAVGGTPTGNQQTSLIQTGQALNTLYNWGSKAYNWMAGGTAGAGASSAAGMYSLAGSTGSLGGTGGAGLYAGTGMGGTGSGLSVAGGTTAASTGSSGAGAGSSGAGMFAVYAAIAVMSYKQAQKDWVEGFRREQSSEAMRENTAIRPIFGAQDITDSVWRALGVSDKTASLLSGSSHAARLFGHGAAKVDSTGIMGNLSGGGFQGQSFADMKQEGGWFRSDRNWTETQAVPEELGKFMSIAAKSVMDQAKEFGKAIGLPAESLAAVSTQIKIALTDDADENQKAIEAAMAKYGEALVESWATQVKSLAVYGETTGDTIARVGTALLGVNDVLLALGGTALEASTAGGAAAIALVDLFGSLDGLRTAASAYYENFYTEGEKVALTSKNIAATLAEVGLTMPKTRAEFRALVESQSLMTTAGREAAAVLMSVSGAFADIVPEAVVVKARTLAEITEERLGLENELLVLQGDTAELRRRELAALDPLNRALQLQVWAAEDAEEAVKDYNKQMDKAAVLVAKVVANAARIAEDTAREMTRLAEEAARQAERMTDAWASAMGTVADGVTAAYRQVASVAGAERTRIEAAANKQLSVLENQAAAAQSTFDQLASAIGNFVSEVKSQISALEGELTADGGRAKAEATIKAAMRSGLDMDAIKGAIGTFAKVDPSKYMSSVDYKREISRTAGVLRDVNVAADTELKTQRRNLTSEVSTIAAAMVAIEATRDNELDLLDSQVAVAKAMASSLVNIDTGVTSVADAMAALVTSIDALKAGTGKGPAPEEQWLRSGNTEVWQSAAGAIGTRPVGDSDPSNLLIKGKLAMFTEKDADDFIAKALSEGRYMDIYLSALEQGVSLADVNRLGDLGVGTAEKWARDNNLPVFAAGGLHNGGLRLVGEYGAELEATGPARYFNASQTRAIMAPATQDGKLEQLRTEVVALLMALASHASTTTNYLHRWEGEGLLTRTA